MSTSLLLTHELLIDSSRVGFASAVFKDRQEGRGGGIPPRSLKTQQHATCAPAPSRELGLVVMRRPGPVDVLAVGSIAARRPLPRRLPLESGTADDRARWLRFLTCPCDVAPGVRPADPSGLPRKEVIQPQLPLRLPCYDFTPVTGPTFDGSLP